MTPSAGQLWELIRAANSSISEGLTARCGAPDFHVFERWAMLHACEFAECLQRIADGDIDAPNCETKFAELIQFVTSSHLGVAVGHHAFCGSAFPPFFPALAHSTSFPEYLPVLFEWVSADEKFSGKPEGPTDWKALIDHAWRNREHPIEGYYDYFVRFQAQPLAPSTLEFTQVIADVICKHRDAERKKKSRGRPNRKNRFKDLLMALWMPGALWCRSSAGILKIIDPSAKGTAEDVDALESDISRLRLTRPDIDRRNQLEEEIAEVERQFAEKFGVKIPWH